LTNLVTQSGVNSTESNTCDARSASLSQHAWMNSTEHNDLEAEYSHNNHNHNDRWPLTYTGRYKVSTRSSAIAKIAHDADVGTHSMSII